MSQVWKLGLEELVGSNKQLCFVFVYYGSKKQAQINNLFDLWHSVIVGPWKTPLLLCLFILIHLHSLTSVILVIFI